MIRSFLMLAFCFSILSWSYPDFSEATSSYESSGHNDDALSESDHPLVKKAKDVFERVAAAADKPSAPYPSLKIVSRKQDPWARCNQKGEIILSLNALEICYDGVPEHIGSSRLAFVLGHEIAHLAKGDFWHVTVSEFANRYNSKQKGFDEQLQKLLKDPETAQKRELQADSYGMLYAFMAGFNPHVIVDGKNVNFFEEWTNQSSKIAYAKSHPSPKDRASFLYNHLEKIKKEIVFFEIGLRLYQKGDYDEALECLTYFRNIFPCREVFNNIGLVHYQKALNSLSVFDKERAYRFKLATVTDTDSRARIRGIPENNFKREIQEAIDNFKTACENDIHYLPSRVNLASAFILKGEYTRALTVLEEALQIKKNDLNALNNNAVAFYQFGLSQKIDTTATFTKILNDVFHIDSSNTDALYNLGSILLDQKKNLEAVDIWEVYLKKESKGPYAIRVLEKIGKSETRSSKKNPPVYETPSPIRVGYADAETKRKLADFSGYHIEIGSMQGTYYSENAVKLLVVRRSVKYVETPPETTVKLNDVFLKYGKPDRIISAASGLETFVYNNNFALDIWDGKAIKVVYFK